MKRRDFLKVGVAGVLAISPLAVLAATKPRVHTFSNLVGIDGKAITATIYPEHEESFAAAGKSGRDAAAKLIELLQTRRD